MKYKAVYVEWIDACTWGCSSWESLDEVAKLTADKIFSLGFIIHETKDHLTICGHHGGNTVSGNMCIPKRAIVKRRLLRKP